MSKEFKVADLKKFDGVIESRIYVALNGKVYDVTERGKTNYGPGGHYSTFAGKDISRAMATMAMVTKETYDDLSDLNDEQRKSLLTWENNFLEKYPVVGKLVQ